MIIQTFDALFVINSHLQVKQLLNFVLRACHVTRIIIGDTHTDKHLFYI